MDIALLVAILFGRVLSAARGFMCTALNMVHMVVTFQTVNGRLAPTVGVV